MLHFTLVLGFMFNLVPALRVAFVIFSCWNMVVTAQRKADGCRLNDTNRAYYVNKLFITVSWYLQCCRDSDSTHTHTQKNCTF